ncbi:MAG: hypothetical protein U1E17_13375 [Geminicoccaceae bacterium]
MSRCSHPRIWCARRLLLLLDSGLHGRPDYVGEVRHAARPSRPRQRLEARERQRVATGCLVARLPGPPCWTGWWRKVAVDNQQNLKARRRPPIARSSGRRARARADLFPTGTVSPSITRCARKLELSQTARALEGQRQLGPRPLGQGAPADLSDQAVAAASAADLAQVCLALGPGQLATADYVNPALPGCAGPAC